MIELSEMRANVPVDAGRFLKPLSPVVARPAK
jgi:hypothetical protein